MSCEVVQPGMLTTVQDLGRHGHQREGVPVSGAMDAMALRIGNMLVGNEEGAAALELTIAGPTLRFDAPALIALVGAAFDATVNGHAVPTWRASLLPAGTTLAIGGATRGCRGYLAVAGGIDVAPVLGSRSTYTRAALGGMEGRALRRGDTLPFGEPPPLARRIVQSLAGRAMEHSVAPWGAGPSLIPRYAPSPTVRVIDGRHAHLLTPSAREELWRAEFRIAPQSDRMGFRLEGTALQLGEPRELLSEAVAFGTVQLPPGGEPIILMADRQTTGGYPRIGEIATVDLSLVAQLKPGDGVRFRSIALDEAQALYLAREADLARARTAIALRYRGGS